MSSKVCFMFLGIDIGASGVKAILMDAEQTVLTQQNVSLCVSNPKPLWSEQDPEAWYQAVLAGVDAIKVSHGDALSRLSAIGLTGQMHGAVCLGETGVVLRPAILWNDGRSFQECEDLMQDFPEFLTEGGNRVMPGFTAPKLLWLQRYFSPKIIFVTDSQATLQRICQMLPEHCG